MDASYLTELQGWRQTKQSSPAGTRTDVHGAVATKRAIRARSVAHRDALTLAGWRRSRPESSGHGATELGDGWPCMRKTTARGRHRHSDAVRAGSGSAQRRGEYISEREELGGGEAVAANFAGASRLPAASRERRKDSGGDGLITARKRMGRWLAPSRAHPRGQQRARAKRREWPRCPPVNRGRGESRDGSGYCSINTTSFLHFLFSLNYSQICIAT
jgi:hypothetical protein